MTAAGPSPPSNPQALDSQQLAAPAVGTSRQPGTVSGPW